MATLVMTTLVIEVHHGARHDTQFHRVESFPFTIGRAYDNDLILVDDTISPHHLQIEASEESGYQVRNLSKENGTWCGNRQLGPEAEPLRPPVALSLGRTHLRILSTDTAVAPTRTFPHTSWLTRWASDLRVAIGLLTVYLMLSIYFALERQALWFNWQEVLVNQLLEIVLPLVVATVIAFISHILLHRWRFPLQLSIACLAIGLLTFSEEIVDTLSYWLTNYEMADLLSTLAITACFIGLLAWQLRAISSLSRKWAAWTSVAIVVPLTLILQLQSMVSQPAFSVIPPMHTLLKPKDVRIAQNYDSIEELRLSIEEELQQGLQQELRRDEQTADQS